VKGHTTSSATSRNAWHISGACHGHGDDDAGRPFLSQRGYGRAHRRTGRQAVIHEDHGLAVELGKGRSPAIATFASLELGLLGCG